MLELHSKLIVLRISGDGQTGPYKDKPGFGVVAEAMGGLRHLMAELGRVPVRVRISTWCAWNFAGITRVPYMSVLEQW